jgi:lipoate-protein ligase B
VALERQELYVEDIKGKRKSDTIIFCAHSPVVTKGRSTKPDDVYAWDGSVVEVSRGGRATYHGPSQIVVYPIISIKEGRQNSGPNNVGAFLRDFENAIVKALLEYGVHAVGKSYQKKNNSDPAPAQEETGVWVENRKVASLGLSVRHWITFHGAAINFRHDPDAFKGMNPCGFQSSVMVSLEELLIKLPERNHFIETLQKHLRIELA